jgi:alpha-tubulin suppressor-like RCC1 family protein
MTEDGRLFVWGPALDPAHSLLEPQELRADKKVMQVCVGEEMSALINSDGHIFTWGINNQSG